MLDLLARLLRIQGRKVHIPDLLRELGAVLDRPVSDKTGFTDEFDLDLSFTPSDATLGIPATFAVADPNMPNLFAAAWQTSWVSPWWRPRAGGSDRNRSCREARGELKEPKQSHARPQQSHARSKWDFPPRQACRTNYPVALRISSPYRYGR